MTEEKRYKILELVTTGYHLIENRAYNLTREECDALINEYVGNGQNPNSLKAVLVNDPRYSEEVPSQTGYVPFD
jgi:hypothetical protein|tara:strand:+ start:51 stop:272 length:222 start_codon:yes stop_codon:yes gene_type:complete